MKEIFLSIWSLN